MFREYRKSDLASAGLLPQWLQWLEQAGLKPGARSQAGMAVTSKAMPAPLSEPAGHTGDSAIQGGEEGGVCSGPSACVPPSAALREPRSAES